MKTLHKILVLWIMILTICSCESILTDQVYNVGYDVVYSNNSNHSLDIVCDSQYYQYPCELEISQGERCFIGFLFSIPGNTRKQRDEKAQKLIIPEMVTLVYDDEYSITFSRGTGMDNLCNMSDYVCTRLSEQDIECSYTFTEADYEYAKENGTRIETE